MTLTISVAFQKKRRPRKRGEEEGKKALPWEEGKGKGKEGYPHQRQRGRETEGGKKTSANLERKKKGKGEKRKSPLLLSPSRKKGERVRWGKRQRA